MTEFVCDVCVCVCVCGGGGGGEECSRYIVYISNTIHMYSGITSGRVLDAELLYRLFHRDLSPIKGTLQTH